MDWALVRYSNGYIAVYLDKTHFLSFIYMACGPFLVHSCDPNRKQTLYSMEASKNSRVHLLSYYLHHCETVDHIWTAGAMLIRVKLKQNQSIIFYPVQILLELLLRMRVTFRSRWMMLWVCM